MPRSHMRFWHAERVHEAKCALSAAAKSHTRSHPTFRQWIKWWLCNATRARMSATAVAMVMTSAFVYCVSSSRSGRGPNRCQGEWRSLSAKYRKDPVGSRRQDLCALGTHASASGFALLPAFRVGARVDLEHGGEQQEDQETNKCHDCPARAAWGVVFPGYC